MIQYSFNPSGIQQTYKSNINDLSSVRKNTVEPFPKKVDLKIQNERGFYWDEVERRRLCSLQRCVEAAFQTFSNLSHSKLHISVFIYLLRVFTSSRFNLRIQTNLYSEKLFKKAINHSFGAHKPHVDM